MNIKQLAEQLRSVRPFPDTPIEIFDTLRRILPMVAVELFVVDHRSRFLLIRKKSSQFEGWVMPGGFLGFNESFENACRRIVQKEFGVGLKSAKFFRAFNWPEGDVRRTGGHAVSLIFRCTIDVVPKNAQYFSVVPDGTLEHHVAMLSKIVE